MSLPAQNISELTKVWSLQQHQSEEWKPIFASLLRAQEMLGIKNPESKIGQPDYAIIKEFLLQEFRDFSAVDIRFAFEYFCAGKTSLNERQFVNTSTLNCRFIGAVLMLYRPIMAEKQREERIKNMKQVSETTQEIKLEPKKCWENLVYFVEKFRELPEWGSNLFIPAYNYAAKNYPEFAPSGAIRETFIASLRSNLTRRLNDAKTQGNRFYIDFYQNTLENDTSFSAHCKVEWAKKFLTEKYLKG